MNPLRRAVVVVATIVSLLVFNVCLATPFDDGVTAYDQGHFDVAFRLWLPLAQQGDVGAQFRIAALYEQGSGVIQDNVQAARWYLAAAEQGDRDAELKIADLYASGTGVAKDRQEARKWYDALIADPHEDKPTLALKQQARVHLADVIGVTQEIIPYDGGRFVLVRAPSGTCLVALQGKITRDTPYKFDDVVARSTQLGCVKPTLMLESPGGSLLAGIRIGNAVRAQGFQTITRYQCSSSCGLIFMGGVERTIAGSRAAIGLHQPSTFGLLGDDKHCSDVAQQPGAHEMRRYIEQMLPQTGQRVIDTAMKTSCRSITLVSGQRALDLGVATKVEFPTTDLFGPEAARR